MKIKLTETQIQKVLKEVGGYDSLDIMGIHGGSVQGEITRIVSQTVDFMNEFSNRLRDGSLSKEELMTGIFNFSEKIQSDIIRLKELSREIYIDDDFKSLMISYIRSLEKVLKYFKLLSNVSPGMMGGQAEMFGGGLGMDMSDHDLSLEVATKLAGIGEYLKDLGEMFNTMMGRYGDRLQGGERY